MRSKLKWGPTIQQNNNVIYVVNLGTEAKRFTHGIQSIDTIDAVNSSRGGDRGHLPNKGCAGSAKSRPGKNYKISVQMMLSIRIDKSV